MKLKQDRNKTSGSQNLTNTSIGIRAENMGLAFQDLIRYSNPIESIVREITSNCFDAHKDAGVDAAPLIKYTEPGLESSQAYISFIDYGNGMDPEKMENIYGSLYESDKRDSNEKIGAFGIGSKSPLAYSDTYWVITVNQGTKYTYLISNDGVEFSLVLMDERETNEHSGTEVKIPVNHEDSELFSNAIMTQLKFFKRVEVEGLKVPDNKIAEGNDFIVSKWQKGVVDNNPSSGTDGVTRSYHFRFDRENMSICLGEVSYPIRKESISQYSKDDSVHEMMDTPVGIKFNIGELPVTSKREDVRYTEEAIKTIIDRIKSAKEELDEMAEKQSETDSYYDIVEEISNRSSGNLRISNSLSIRYFNYSGKRILTSYPSVDPADVIEFLISNFKIIKKDLNRESTPLYHSDLPVKNVCERICNKPETVYYRTEDHTARKNWAILERTGATKVITIRPIDEKELTITPHAMNRNISINHEVIRGTGEDYSIDEMRRDVSNIVKEFNKWLKSYLPCYDEIELTEEETERRQVLLNEEREESKKNKNTDTPCKIAGYKTAGAHELVFRESYLRLFQNSGIIIYGHKDDRDDLHKAFITLLKQSLYSTGSSSVGEDMSLDQSIVDVMMIAKNNLKVLKNKKKNIIPVSKYLEADNIFFRDFMTCYHLIEKAFPSYHAGEPTFDVPDSKISTKRIIDAFLRGVNPSDIHLYMNDRGYSIVILSKREIWSPNKNFKPHHYLGNLKDRLCPDMSEEEAKIYYLQSYLDAYCRNHFNNIYSLNNKAAEIYEEYKDYFNHYNLWNYTALEAYDELLNLASKYPLASLAKERDIREERASTSGIMSLEKEIRYYMNRVDNLQVNPRLINKLKTQ